MDNWPTSLPQKFLENGFSETLAPTVLRSDNDAGPPKVRQRFTASFDQISGAMHITAAQRVTLTDFYKNTLAGGSKTFLFDDPFDGTEREYRFVNPPEYAPLGGDVIAVRLSWETVP